MVLPFEVDEVQIEAAADGDLFGSVEFRKNPVHLRLEPLPEKLRRYYWTHFDRFAGSIRVSTWQHEIEFLDEGWEVRSPREIEIGYPAAPNKTGESKEPNGDAAE